MNAVKEKKRYRPFKTVTLVASAVLPKYKTAKKEVTSPGNKIPFLSFRISLIQAARDGLIDVVKSHLQCGFARIHDVDEDGFTALHHAARYNRTRVLEALVAAGGNVNVKGGQDEMRPLHMASRYNNDNVTQLLLTRGAAVNVKDIKGKTALHYATRRGHSMVTKMLLSVSRCDVDAADNDQTTPLTMACIQGNWDVCEALISRGADIRKRDINGMTPLMWACAEGHPKVVQLLLKSALKRGQDHQRVYVRLIDSEGNNALHLAVQNGSLEICELLLNHHADINCQKMTLSTPLHVAATHGFDLIGDLLIYRGADVNKADADHRSPIHRAALFNKVDMIKRLMSHGGNINAKDKQNMSPLHCACWKGETEATLFLLDHGAQVAEVDSSLKTPLHWAVQFGHYETLLVLLKHGGANLLQATDKNDQTVLHYAAFMGNISVLKTLLDAGAKPNAKDQEERTPLHTAAQYGNVNCVEALIHASIQEINDDDVDGRTPLMLASMHGHYQVVQVLISLAADITKRDDEHSTALMLAAAQGHSCVMKILLENQANVSQVDKSKNSALHYACAGGHIEAVQLLLDKKADVKLKNARDQAPMDLAIDNFHNEACLTMLKHYSWRECMSVRDSNGLTPFDRLIAKLPEGAMVILDHCVERNSRDNDDPNLLMVFDYQYVDPGPDDQASSPKRYLALNTMVSYERDLLLSHPLCQNMLSQKWVRYGRTIFYFNLLMYVGYLLTLTMYVSTMEVDVSSNDVSACKAYITNNTIDRNITLSQFLEEHYKYQTAEVKKGPLKSDVSLAFAYLLVVFISVFFFREFFKLISHGWNYLISFCNWISWTLMISTFVFLYPIGMVPTVSQWRGGWVALFLAWINFIMYLRRIDFVGIYVIMFVTVLVSLLKAILVFFFFCWAFAGSFYIVMHRKGAFTNIWTALINIFVMTLGEIEYVDTFIPTAQLQPDANILLFIFLFLMPIVLMNLMIGIAVGDIDKIQQSAYLKRIELQVDLLYSIENNMPKFLQRKVYVRRATIKPNEGGKLSLLERIKRFVLGSTKSVQFIPPDQKDKLKNTLQDIREEVRCQRNRLKSLKANMKQQTTLLQQIAAKLDIDGPPAPAPDLLLSPCPRADSSLYDNMSMHHRRLSVRDPPDRPKSVVIM